jgi:DNA-binding CsgD family transcriptional regulator
MTNSALGRRRRTDGLSVGALGPREREALSLTEQKPGITVVELAEAMDVSLNGVWQYVNRLEASRVRREPRHEEDD